MTSEVKRLIVQALRHAEDVSRSSKQSARPKSRVGKKALVAHVEPNVAWQLKKLALDQSVTVQSLLEEALDDLFIKYHLK